VNLALRFAVLKRDRFTCVYCGGHPPNVELQVDHFHPASRGGADHIDNLVTACRECNAGKGTTLFDGDEFPEDGSPLWHWVLLGANEAKGDIGQRLLNREPEESLADVVEELWPEADY
jgi:hypothetical protein